MYSAAPGIRPLRNAGISAVVNTPQRFIGIELSAGSEILSFCSLINNLKQL